MPAGALVGLFIFCIQEIGMMLGMGGEAVYLASREGKGTLDRELFESRARFAVRTALVFLVLSETFLVTAYLIAGETTSLYEPTHIFKWFLFVLILIFIVLHHTQTVQKISAVGAVATWFALFILNNFVPQDTLWGELVFGYLVCLAVFAVVYYSIILFEKQKTSASSLKVSAKTLPPPIPPAPKVSAAISSIPAVKPSPIPMPKPPAPKVPIPVLQKPIIPVPPPAPLVKPTQTFEKTSIQQPSPQPTLQTKLETKSQAIPAEPLKPLPVKEQHSLFQSIFSFISKLFARRASSESIPLPTSTTVIPNATPPIAVPVKPKPIPSPIKQVFKPAPSPITTLLKAPPQEPLLEGAHAAPVLKVSPPPAVPEKKSKLKPVFISEGLFSTLKHIRIMPRSPEEVEPIEPKPAVPGPW